jgi:ribosomal protein L11 methyltransferase
MPEPVATTVVRLAADAATARKIDDAIAESFDPAEVATSAFEEPDGRWSLAMHFRQAPDKAVVSDLVASVAGVAAADALSFETLPPTDWVRKGLEGLTPVTAGRFIVHGAHHRDRARTRPIAIEIEASLAFGTGHHGTTRGCLLALDRILRAKRPSRVLDVGTGSGVLAIAAAKATHRRVLASDVDARAVRIARENARLNGVSGLVEVVHAGGLGQDRFHRRAPFDLILANILLAPLQQLATPLRSLVAPNGYVVLSGLLTAQATAALASYRVRGLVLVQRIALGGWATLVLLRPSRGTAAQVSRLRAATAPCRGRHQSWRR